MEILFPWSTIIDGIKVIRRPPTPLPDIVLVMNVRGIQHFITHGGTFLELPASLSALQRKIVERQGRGKWRGKSRTSKKWKVQEGRGYPGTRGEPRGEHFPGHAESLCITACMQQPSVTSAHVCTFPTWSLVGGTSSWLASEQSKSQSWALRGKGGSPESMANRLEGWRGAGAYWSLNRQYWPLLKK